VAAMSGTARLPRGPGATIAGSPLAGIPLRTGRGNPSPPTPSVTVTFEPPTTGG